MYMRNIETMLEYEVRKKPVVADLVARAEDLTDEELQAAPVLPWIKNILRDRRNAAQEKRIQAEKLAALEEMAEANQHLVMDGTVPDPMGTAYRWFHGEEWVTVTARGSAIQMRYNDLVWFPDAGGVWIDTVYVRNPQPNFRSKLVEVERTTMLGYHRIRQERLLQANGDAPVMLTLDHSGGHASQPSGHAAMSPALAQLGSLGVRIGRL
jgi:hypothetical protein